MQWLLMEVLPLVGKCIDWGFFCGSQAANLSDGFTWMHVHQTWLEGAAAKDQTNWLF